MFQAAVTNSRFSFGASRKCGEWKKDLEVFSQPSTCLNCHARLFAGMALGVVTVAIVLNI